MAQHSPAPWTIRKGAYGVLWVGPAQLPHPGKEMEAYAQRRGESRLAERDADAALISTAPDMLATLAELVAAWDAFDTNGPAPLDDIVTKARAIVAKAKP